MKWLALPAVLMATVVFAQKPAEPKPSPGKDGSADKARRPSLEELLAAALQHSPEVQVAEAKLKEAEAQLKHTRLQVAQRLVDLYTSSEAQQKNLNFAEEEFKRVYQMRQQGTVSAGELAETERKLQMLKGQVAQLEASVATLTGRLPLLNQLGTTNPNFNFIEYRDANLPLGNVQGGGSGFGLGDGGPKPRWPRQPIADRMLKALDQPIAKFNKFENITLADLMDYVREQSKDVPVLAKLDGREASNVTINFNGDLTLGSFFEVLTDSVPGFKVFVRDYGFLMAFEDNAPEDGLGVGDFWRKRQMPVK
jgi:hypothetical protein